ncbi:Response regulator receiver domain-containing protein [Neorhodopirellula lusitana]|uniref:Response regulator receiver domain-containing protein n=1 Tax=Neorhodopirellula lusitana TaxID=445327 RepID=A0ABY1QFZ9_9BACT|nr:response regulator [Neorhodopirellula lusitana]SMP67223.1 Response regulator receiver domain-containing protein [Neorhodopirellula lusitana]
MTLRCLVADDVRHNRSLAIHWLHELGYSTMEATDGEDAWRIVKQYPLDLVITDIEMPRQSGLELIQHLREHDDPNVAHTPVVVMSSLQDDLLETAALHFGATIVLHKPLDREDFLQAANAALAKDASEVRGKPDPDTLLDEESHPGVISPTLRRIIDRTRDRS